MKPITPGAQPRIHKPAAANAPSKKPNGTHVGAEGIELTRDSAASIWERCIAATEAHGYIKRKGGAPSGLRVVPQGDPLVISQQSVAGWLAVPLCDLTSGEVVSLQFIAPSKRAKIGGKVWPDKLMLPGSMGDAAFVMGEVREGANVVVVEGLGQGWTCRRVDTGEPELVVAVACGWSRVSKVAAAVQARAPGAWVAVVPDAGMEQHAEDIASELGCGFVRLPTGLAPNTGIDDIAQKDGDEAVVRLIHGVEFLQKKVKKKAGGKPDEPELPETPEHISKVTDALGHLSADMGRADWFRVLAALHNLGWEQGLDIADQWSSHGDKYMAGEVEKIWTGFDNSESERRASADTLFWMARYAGWNENEWARQRLQQALANAKPGTGVATAEATDQVAELLPPAFSEDNLALEFVQRGADAYRWSPGLGWIVNSPAASAWVPDDQLTRYELARRVCRAASNVATADGEKRRLASAKTVAAVLSLGQADPRIVVPTKVWDADPLLLNTPGGIVDLRTGQLRQRRTDDLVMQCTGAAPDFEAKAPVFERFVSDVFGGDARMVAFVQRMLGYCITGDRREQVLFFWHGSGANGKGTLMDLVVWLLGAYAIKLASAALMLSRQERHPTELAQLQGKRMALSSELETGQHLAEALVKELTGDETLSARRMRQDPYTFTMTQKHVLVGNYKPRIRGSDPAIARRLVLVPFEVTFDELRRDRQMLEKLKAEAPAILAWVIEGARRWHETGLDIPKAVRAASAAYISDHNDIEQWAEDCCERKGSGAAAGLYSSFQSWKERRGEHAPSATVWFQELQKVPGIQRGKTASGHVYSGIDLTESERTRLRLEARK